MDETVERLLREGISFTAPLTFPPGPTRPVKAAKSNPGPAARKPSPTQRPTNDAIAKWENAIHLAMEDGLTRAEATKRVVHTQPALHSAFLEAINR